MNPNPVRTGLRAFAYVGVNARLRQWAGTKHEYNRPGLRTMARYWAMIKRLRQWAQSEHPDVVARFYAMADIELARADAAKLQQDKRNGKVNTPMPGTRQSRRSCTEPGTP